MAPQKKSGPFGALKKEMLKMYQLHAFAETTLRVYVMRKAIL